MSAGSSDQRLLPVLVAVGAFATRACSSDGPPSSPAPAQTDSGGYTQGVYTCCAEGTGVSCCTAERGLLAYEVQADGAVRAVGARADGQTSANCFQYGGVKTTCTGAGEFFERKDICAICCDGLATLEPSEPSDGGGCGPGSLPPSAGLCAACGNSNCEAGETRCNCPADCK